MLAPDPVSFPCVPVSTTERRCPNGENCAYQAEIKSAELIDAINLLLDSGFKFGCDGELLPPRWVFGA